MMMSHADCGGTVSAIPRSSYHTHHRTPPAPADDEEFASALASIGDAHDSESSLVFLSVNMRKNITKAGNADELVQFVNTLPAPPHVIVLCETKYLRDDNKTDANTYLELEKPLLPGLSTKYTEVHHGPSRREADCKKTTRNSPPHSKRSNSRTPHNSHRNSNTRSTKTNRSKTSAGTAACRCSSATTCHSK